MIENTEKEVVKEAKGNTGQAHPCYAAKSPKSTAAAELEY